MDGSITRTWMSDILHAITQGLLTPDILLLIGFIGYALFCIGSVIVEYFTERRHFRVTMPKFLAALMSAEEDEIPEVIENSGLLKRQKLAMLTVYDYRVLPGDALVALIRRLVTEEEGRYDRITGRNNMAARVSPMLGLMGTLIPLGPGIEALGQQNTEVLSTSLLIAFDTTVAGLVVAAVCMVIGKIRGIWYTNYMSALDTGMATMLQKIEDMRAEGKIVTEEPSDYAFLFEQETAKDGGSGVSGIFSKFGKSGKANGAHGVENADGFDNLGGLVRSEGGFGGSMANEGTGVGASIGQGENGKVAGGFAAHAARDTQGSPSPLPAPPAFPAPPAAPAAPAAPATSSAPVTPKSSATTSPVDYASLANPRMTSAGPAASESSTQPAQAAQSAQSDAHDGNGLVSAQPTLSGGTSSFMPAVGQADLPQQAKAPDAMQPLKANAAFAPVPDPAFISDLAAAASTDARIGQQPSASASESASQPTSAPSPWYLSND